MRRGVLLFLALGLVGCYPNKDNNDYARRAYHNQQHEQANSATQARVDQGAPEDRTLAIGQFQEDPFPRLPWETVDDWMERLQNQLLLNHKMLVELRGELAAVEDEEHGLIRQLQVTIAMNERLRTQLSEMAAPDPIEQQDREMFAMLPPPSFKMHLVKRGETLYSIAREEYGDPGMYREILLWNQGWLRDPHQITAGLALILFSEDSDERNEQVVENYVGQWMALQ